MNYIQNHILFNSYMSYNYIYMQNHYFFLFIFCNLYNKNQNNIVKENQNNNFYLLIIV